MYKFCEFENIESTSEYLKENLKENLIVVADCQSKGKGRTGNKFYSPKGGIYFSYAIKANFNLDAFTIKIGLAIKKVLEEYNYDCKLKWVNDLYYNGKKLGGIIVERKDEYLIIGIGLNINNDVSEISSIATSITINNLNKKEFIVKIVETIDEYIDRNDIIDEFNKSHMLMNKQVDFTYNNQDFTGKIVGINNKGELLIDMDGKMLNLNSGIIKIHKGDEVK